MIGISISISSNSTKDLHGENFFILKNHRLINLSKQQLKNKEASHIL
jgi:hypothetical protein